MESAFDIERRSTMLYWVDAEQHRLFWQRGCPGLAPEALDHVTIAASDFEQRPTTLLVVWESHVARQRVNVDPAGRFCLDFGRRVQRRSGFFLTTRGVSGAILQDDEIP